MRRPAQIATLLMLCTAPAFAQNAAPFSGEVAAPTLRSTLAAPDVGSVGTPQVTKGAAVDGADAEAVETVATCGEQSFESTAEVTVDGKKRRNRVKLCAKPGSTDADWLATLDKALIAIDEHPGLTAEAKTKISGDLKAEIARLRVVR